MRGISDPLAYFSGLNREDKDVDHAVLMYQDVHVGLRLPRLLLRFLATAAVTHISPPNRWTNRTLAVLAREQAAPAPNGLL